MVPLRTDPKVLAEHSKTCALAGVLVQHNPLFALRYTTKPRTIYLYPTSTAACGSMVYTASRSRCCCTQHTGRRGYILRYTFVSIHTSKYQDIHAVRTKYHIVHTPKIVPGSWEFKCHKTPNQWDGWDVIYIMPGSHCREEYRYCTHEGFRHPFFRRVYCAGLGGGAACTASATVLAKGAAARSCQ